MAGEHKERWKEVWEQAAKEPNAEKMLQLLEELNRC
jgi:hypothetical protein